MLYIVAESWADRHSGALVAAGALASAMVLLLILDRFVAARLSRLLEAPGVTPRSMTQLRFAWRLFETGIVVVAVGIAIQQFADLDKVANAILASSAILAAVVGFASRTTIGNAVAGLQLAVSQPVRIGDFVTFEGETGTIEEVRLTSTWMRTPADARIVIPNERLASGILRNDSISSPSIAVEASIWLSSDVDETKALAAAESVTGVRARIAESGPDGRLRLLAIGEAAPVRERMAREGDLRRDVLRALREAGVR